MKRLLICVLTILLFSSCAFFQATTGDKESMKEKYYAALRFFNDTVEDYIVYYNRADEETKAKWDREITPAVKKASVALDIWWDHINAETVNEKFAVWEKVKYELLLILMTNNLIR